MARIVLVHGAFNELWGPNELKARWLPAVRDGLWHHGVELAEDDVAVCFYGDLFRRHPGTEEEELLEHARPGIAEALHDLDGGDALAAIGQAASEAVFERTVDMVAVMAAAPDLRQRLRERVERVVGDDTVALVAHSFGTVVAYGALAHRPDWSVDTFVTLGSPLASPLLSDSLDPAPVDGLGVWPGTVRRWVNVRARHDKACTWSLTERFGSRVDEFEIDNGHRYHAPEPYLNARHTGAAIAESLSR